MTIRRSLGVLAAGLIVSGCGAGRSPLEQVQAFCSGISNGENIKAVLGRYEKFGLQPGGTAGHARERLSGMVDAKSLDTISNVLAEPSPSRDAGRPVCAIYYSSRLLGGDDKVVLAEFKPDWAYRY